MSGILRLHPGQHIRLNSAQMEQLQLSSFSPEQAGTGTSNLAQYAPYNFSWFIISNATAPANQGEDQVSTFKRTDFVYHLTMHKKYALPPLDTPVLLAGDQLISLAIRLNGRSDRPDLQDYRFTSIYQEINEKSEAVYTVTMRRI